MPRGTSPAHIASVGTYSGPAASTLKPVLDGAQLWVKYINSKGGLNGHPVKLAVYDDGGDPARHRAQVQEAVEQRKVVAFLANAEALTGQGSNDYIASHRVPVIGVDGGWDFPYDNPMYFLQHPSGEPLYLSFVLSAAQQLVPAGKKKLATLTCQEAQACGVVSRLWKDRAAGLGLELVYQARASIAQPDYTAECLAARNAGAEGFFVLLDGNGVGRLAASCARQGYKPQYALATTVILDRFKDDPNLDGAIGGTDVMPWFQTGTPAADEFQGALKVFGGGLPPGVGMVTGWTAGKLLERAAGTTLSEPPTSESVLRGLWTIKDDNLGGLTYPLTFAEGAKSVRKTCWFSLRVKDGKWSSPDGNRQFCGQ
ncbi:MAG TPA: ABC transporter substrate-binding protein [Acidimicrobiia bacterium]|nr:ABC transporter substrate-binding protein [Acidimicrobiia bacterium]